MPAWAERDLSGPPAPPDSATDDGHPIEFPPPVTVDLWTMSQAAIVIADGFPSSELDFVTPIRAFAAVLDRRALPEEQLGSDPTYQPRAYLRTWLEDKAAPREGGAGRLP